MINHWKFQNMRLIRLWQQMHTYQIKQFFMLHLEIRFHDFLLFTQSFASHHSHNVWKKIFFLSHNYQVTFFYCVINCSMNIKIIETQFFCVPKYFAVEFKFRWKNIANTNERKFSINTLWFNSIKFVPFFLSVESYIRRQFATVDSFYYAKQLFKEINDK